MIPPLPDLEAPTNLPAFQRLFPSDGACRDYLFRVRWPDGFVCPKCGSTVGYTRKDRPLIECPNGHQTSVTAGTVMHRSKMPICTWFQAAYLITELKPGISALQFQATMGIARFETAFNLLHKLRSSLMDPDRKPLEGEVQIDEAFVGGAEVGRPGRGSETKALVIVAVEIIRYEDTKTTGQRGHERQGADGPPELVERDGGKVVIRKRAGRCRMSVIPNAGADTLIPWIKANVAPGTLIQTDGWSGYGSLSKLGYAHERVLQSHKGKPTGKYLPMVHLMISNLKRWLDGTHKGAVLPRHLQAYLNEFCFRFNRRFWRGPAFLRILGLAMEAPHAWPEYKTLYGSAEKPKWEHPDRLRPLAGPVAVTPETAPDTLLPDLDEQTDLLVRAMLVHMDARQLVWATQNGDRLREQARTILASIHEHVAREHLADLEAAVF